MDNFMDKFAPPRVLELTPETVAPQRLFPRLSLSNTDKERIPHALMTNNVTHVLHMLVNVNLIVVRLQIACKSFTIACMRDNKALVVRRPSSIVQHGDVRGLRIHVLFLVFISFFRGFLGMWGNWCFWLSFFCFLFRGSFFLSNKILQVTMDTMSSPQVA